MLSLAESHIMNLESYIPGRSIKKNNNKYKVNQIIKLASNENSIGPSPKAIKAASEEIFKCHIYPIYNRFCLKEKICKKYLKYGIKSNNIVLGNGTNEIITLLVRTFIGYKEILLNAWPSFIVYRLAAKAFGRREISVPLTFNLDYDLSRMSELSKNENVKMIFIANPNNPTGKYIAIRELISFAQNLPKHIILVIDEAYFDYVDKNDYDTAIPLILSRPRTVILRTFSKIFGLAGLRIGYAICDQKIAEIIHRIRDPFNVNGIAQVAALAALDDVEHVKNSKLLNNSELLYVTAGMKKIGFHVTESVGNFVLMHLENYMENIDNIIEKLIEKGIIIRPLKNYNLTRAARVTIGTRNENKILLEALEEIIH